MLANRRLVELFEIDHPIVLAPMAGLGTVDLAAAVSNAGGLGSIACAIMAPELVAKTVAELRRLTTKPINLNFFCHDPARADAAREHAWHDKLSLYYRELGIDAATLTQRFDVGPFDDAACTVVENLRPEVVSFHFGLPQPRLVDRIKAAGCKVISSATTVEEACWLEKHGADAIIAQGYEAGGHKGMFLDSDRKRAVASQAGTFALVPQVADAVSVPVIAAGGIGDGRGIAAAFALGAAGVQVGTAFLLCPESATPPLHREALRNARVNRTVVTNVFSGRPARVLVNRLAEEIGPWSDAAPDFPLPTGELPPLRTAAEQSGSADFSPLWAGQAAALAREMPAKMLIEVLVREATKLRAADVRDNAHASMAWPETAGSSAKGPLNHIL
jgi:nitronate monooxygenase